MTDVGNHIAPHLSKDQMVSYLKNQLGPSQMNTVERHLLECELCSEAMEGLEMYDLDKYGTEVEALKDQVSQRTAKKSWNYRYYGIAAAIAVLIVSTFILINRQNQDILPQNESLALDEKSNEQEKLTDSLQLPNVSSNASISSENKSKDSIMEDDLLAIELKPKEDIASGASYSLAEDAMEGDDEKDAAVNGSDGFMESADAEEVELAQTAPAATKTQSLEDRPAMAAQRSEPPEPALIDADVSEEELKEATASIEEKQEERSRSAKMKKQADYKSSETQTIVGTISSYDDNSPITGASIVLKGTTQGTVSDKNGYFSLSAPNGDQTLVVSYVGLISAEVQTYGEDSLQIELEDDALGLSEVVVSAEEAIEQNRILPRPTPGRKSFKKYIEENQVYPEEALKNNIEGRVALKVSFNEFGIIRDIIVQKGLGFGCDEEAIRLINDGPLWEPGKIDGEPSSMEMIIRIRFKLND